MTVRCGAAGASAGSVAARLDGAATRPTKTRRHDSAVADKAGIRGYDPAMLVSTTAYAKLNLALHVRGRRDDGYHELDSVFAFCEDGDELTVEPADALSLTIDGPFGAGLSAGEDNLVLRAARALDAEQGRGARIALTKNLPPASGIGGGSADAAATLHALTELWDLPDDLELLLAIGAELGADVAPCIMAQPLHVTGRGEHFVLLDDPAYHGWPVLLVNPGIPLSTGTVFAGWNGVDQGPIIDPTSFEAVIRDGRNDLTMAAIRAVPEISDVVTSLLAQAPRVARMSGSGATCFALFDDLAGRDAAAANIRAAYPEWWIMASRLR